MHSHLLHIKNKNNKAIKGYGQVGQATQASMPLKLN